MIEASSLAKKDKLANFLLKLVKFISPIFIFTTIIFVFILDGFGDIFFFFFISAFIVYMVLAGYSDSKKGDELNFLSESTPEEVQVMFGNYFSLLSVIVVFVVLLNVYAKNIYPKIPTSWGGGKPQKTEVKTESETYEGLLLSEGINWVYIKNEDDNTVHKINIENVESIRIILSALGVSNDGDKDQTSP